MDSLVEQLYKGMATVKARQDEVGPWGELLALLRAGQKPYASVTMLDGRCYLGRVIKLAEGWVKLVVRGEEVWVSMDAISTWALVDE